MWVVIGLSLICAGLVFPGRIRRAGRRDPLFVHTGGHWRRNYGRRAFLRLGLAATGAAALAWSGLDEKTERFHAQRLRSDGSDRAAGVLKFCGERFWFFNWAAVAAVDAWLRSGPFSEWGRRNFEAMVVGLPVLWTVQRGLGANRPTSENPDPRWRPLAADNTASGHTFMAAIPWLNLARRSPGAGPRWAARGASLLTGWSRLNDRRHFPSQVALGWVIAWNAVEAVQPVQAEKATSVEPAIGDLSDTP